MDCEKLGITAGWSRTRWILCFLCFGNSRTTRISESGQATVALRPLLKLRVTVRNLIDRRKRDLLDMKIIGLLVMILTVGAAQAADGLISIKSAVSVKETIDRLETSAKGKGLIIFARIDHAAGAQKISKTLRPTELLIFGNPQGGTPLMECAQTAGIDLPLKALAWEDAGGQVWLG